MTRAIFLMLCLLNGVAEAVTVSYTTAGNFTWTAPAGVTSATVEAWGGGGGGGAATGNPAKGGGGAGGQYARRVVIVVPGNTYAIVVGAGGTGGVNAAGGVGGDSAFATTTAVAKGGAGGALCSTNNCTALGGLGSVLNGIGDVVYAGGSGSDGAGATGMGGAGGGGAGSAGAGGNAAGNTAGTGTAIGGGSGGAGLTARGTGNAGVAAGGGGGGGYADTGQNQGGGAGAPGRVDITYTLAASVISINCAGACMTNADSVSWTVTFNSGVTGVTSGNFVLVPVGLGGTPAITSVTGSGTTWTVTASTGAGDGTLRLDMTGSGGVSPTVTNLPFTTGQVYTIDRTVPVVSSIARVDPSPTALASVSWNVTFSESVTGVDAADFTLVWAGGAGGGSITSVTGSGALWTVTASTGGGNGTLGLNLVDNDSIIDAVNNTLGGAGVGNGNFAGEVYTLNFTAPSFVFTNSPCAHNIAFGAPGQICVPVVWSPQVAGQDLTGVYVTAVSAAGVPTRLHASQQRTRDMQFGLTCHDPSANAGVQAAFAGLALPLCQANGGTPAVWSATVTATFNAGSPSSAVSYAFNYADVGRVELWMRNSATPAQVGYSGPFVVRPGGFVLSGIQQTAAPNLVNPAAANAAGARFVRAGEAFSVTVNATTCSPASAICTVAGAATPNYGKEVAPESVRLTPALAAGLGLSNNPAIGGSFGAFMSGVATGTAFTWNEVGIITLTPGVADADYLGAGDVIGTASGNVGRFYVSQFALSGAVIANRTGLGGICAAPAGCGMFTYMGEQMSAVFNLVAKAADGVTTLQNYDAANSFAKLDPAAAGNPLALAAADTTAPRTVVGLDMATYGAATGGFVNGVASVTVPFAVTRGAGPSGPFDALAVGVAPVDGDGAALATLDLAVNAGGAPNTHGMVGSTRVRYGRLKLSNAYGSELLLLPVTVTAQFWDGATYAANALDNSSSFAAADVLFSNYRKNLAAGETSVMTPPASVALVNGVGSFRLARPGAGNDGSVDMTVNIIAAYLPGNTARATFGVYKGSNEFIYLREAY